VNEFQAIDAKRRELKLSVSALCRRACVPVTTYWRVATGRKRKWWPQTYRRFETALRGKQVPRCRAEADKMIGDLYRAYVVIFAKELGHAAEVLFADPQARSNLDAQWRASAYVRSLAVYCVTIELGVTGARVGRAVGLTRAAVSQINRRVQDFRDDPKVDALLERVGSLVSNRDPLL
jgi:hypothetical protein